jgi:hypothetical protein
MYQLRRKKKYMIAVVILIFFFAAYYQTSLKDPILFTYAGEKTTLKEATVYARLRQYQIEEDQGENIWNSNVEADEDGKSITLENSVKSSVIEQLKRFKVLTAHADEFKVSLSEDEISELSTVVEELCSTDVGKNVIKSTGCKKSNILDLYKLRKTATKVESAIREKADISISDEELKDSKSSRADLISEKQQKYFEEIYNSWTKTADKTWNDNTSIDQSLWNKVKF